MARLEVHLEELTSANVEYAEESRERAQIQLLQYQNNAPLWTRLFPPRLRSVKKVNGRLYFVFRLPAGSISKSSATNTVRNEPMIIAAPDSTALLLRRQCAAVVWVRSDAYSLENVEKLPVPERAYLLKLVGLVGGGSAKTKAKRIDDHVLTYPVVAGPPLLNAGGAGGGAGGGGGEALLPHLPGTSGLVLALFLAQDQATILSRLPRPDMNYHLKAAGVPVGDGDGIGGAGQGSRKIRA